MNKLDYTYIFGDISDVSNQVRVIDHRENKQLTVNVAINDYQLLCQSKIPAEIADLVDLALTIYVADRISIRQKDFPCQIHVVLPIRHPEIFDRPHIVKFIQDVLYWYTNDYWFFEFKQRSANGRRIELQDCILLTSDVSESVEVALWSGGLDSLAGLFTRLLLKSAENYTLFGTGSNTIIHHTQRRLAKAVRKKTLGLTKFVQIPVKLEETKDLPKNSSQRSRGFVFLLLGAACARVEGQNTLYVYENGIGAINLPFRASEVGLDHARSVHPLSLLRMSELISQLLDISFRFNNPFLLWTKAQMCEGLIQANSTDLIANTNYL